MQWSKLKQRVEAGFAPDLSGRVNVRLTSYCKAHDQFQRGVILVDGKEWFEADNFHWDSVLWQTENEFDDLKRADRSTAIRTAMENLGAVGGFEFGPMLFDFLNMSIDEALKSPLVVQRILAVLDRRLGKRRLTALIDDRLFIVRRFVDLRLSASQNALEVPA